MARKRERCMDSLNLSKIRSPMWELCKKTNSLLKDNLYWIVGNDKKIRIWHNNIGPNSPADNCQALSNLKIWCENNDFRMLFNFSVWTSSERWFGWKIVEIPEHLQADYKTLLFILHGQPPTHLNDADRRGWGKYGEYIVKEGYRVVYKKKNMFSCYEALVAC